MTSESRQRFRKTLAMTSSTGNNAIVLGAGHNGLVCSALLARAGFDVVLLEASGVVGGAAETREFAEGFYTSGCANFIHQLSPQVYKELKLEKHGFNLVSSQVSTVNLNSSGAPVVMSPTGISGVSSQDAEGHQEFSRLMRKFAKLLTTYMNKPPPLLVNGGLRDNLTLAQLGLDIRRLGKADMREFMRMIGINIYDVLNEFFQSDLLKGGISLDAVLGTHLGPRSPNTVLTYLYRILGNFQDGSYSVVQPKGGSGSLVLALERAARDAGVDIRTKSPAKDIIVEHGKVTGVKLTTGEIIRSLRVVSSVDPKTTILSLVGARHCETGFVKRMHHVRANGTASRLNLALSGPPEFDGLDSTQLGQRLLIAPSMEYVERAFNPSKYGECSPLPVMEISIPTINDPDLAPQGQHVLSATVQFSPHRLKGGWSTEKKQRFADTIFDVLDAYAPQLRQQVLTTELLSPLDLEHRYGMHGGHWHHGELSLDQFLFVRPVAGAAQYRTPIDGLYFCGAGAHPGGGLTGLPGRNAAHVITKEAS